MIQSPITSSPNVEVVRRIPIAEVINSYASIGIDIARLAAGVTEICLYRCNDSGLEFFKPESFSGDGQFYAALQAKPWYYMSDKWEYEIALPFVTKGMTVLELGSGSGAFLEKLKRKNLKAVGLELNPCAADQANKAGLDVRCEDIALHAQHAGQVYDCVCSFQVMEHVSNPRAILEASIKCLRPGGRLIMAVPNNGGFIQADHASLLNAPPHHMLRWNDRALKYLANVFPLSLESIIHEKIQPQHYQYFVDLLAERSGVHGSFIDRQIYKLIRRKMATGVVAFASAIMGHTVVATYIKN